MYRALYRKYRPQGFESVVGQNTIVRTLKNSIINNSFSHAYIFFGPRGVGKTTASKIFARAINCLEPVNGDACGKCKNCIHSFEKECVDIIEIDAASNNGVDEIRELKNKISLVPAELKYKVYIIDEVHMLSLGAFNALLKTLEEPPEHAIFILATTDPQKVPETIISRCQCFSFKRISEEMIVKRLREVCEMEGIEVDDNVLLEIAISSDGGMRDALGALDKLTAYTKSKITVDDFAELNGVITSKMLEELCNYIFNGDISQVLSLILKYNNDGKNLIQILLQIMHFSRNMVINYYVDKSNNSNISIDKVLLLVNLINEKMFDIKKSGNPKIYIEMLLIKYIKDNGLALNDSSIENKVEEISCIESSADSTSKNVVDNSDDEEYDFDKEFSDIDDNGDDIDKSVFLKPIKEIESIDSDYSSGNIEQKKVINMDEIIKARVNNTLAKANKQILNTELENIKKLNDFTFDQEIGYIVCSLLDASLRAASEENIILSYEYDSTVRQNLTELDKFIYVYNKITGSSKKIAMITHDEWEKEKEKYIKKIKEGIHYEVIEEPVEVYEESKKDDIISNSAMDLFGDIVEIN